MKVFLFLYFFLFTNFTWAQAYLPEEKTIYLADTIPVHFVLIPAGSLLMGSPESERGRNPDEGPQHQVQITQPFYLGKYEVTQAQWQALMGTNPAVFQQGTQPEQRPVEYVSWKDCERFIGQLNSLGMGSFRLPTEAEWEYACRAGTTSPYYWGEAAELWEVDPYAWINSRSFATTHPVGEKKPNPWGLYDMSGNVWEWCSDWYGPYPAEPQVNPQGPEEGKEKVFRGGSWYDFSDAQRAANRHRHVMDQGYTTIGFRLVMEVKD